MDETVKRVTENENIVVIWIIQKNTTSIPIIPKARCGKWGQYSTNIGHASYLMKALVQVNPNQENGKCIEVYIV